MKVKSKENASISIMKILCISIILILISGIGVMAVSAKLNNVKIILQNGYEMTVLTSKTKVSDILEENNIILEDDEKSVPGLDEEVSEETSIVIKNKSEQEVQIAQISETGVETSLDDLLKNYAPITEKIVVEQVTIPYETITKEATGSGDETRNKVVQNGQDGLKEITYKIKYQNETEIEKTVLSEVVIKEPVNKIVQIQKVTSRASTTSRSTAVSYGGGKWSYSASDIQEILAPIVQYHLHKVLKPRKYVVLLKSMYATDRTSRNKYTIRGENPRGFKEHTGRIATKENNLLKLLML